MCIFDRPLDCDEAWNAFTKSFAYAEECGVTMDRFEDYAALVTHKVPSNEVNMEIWKF